jgi:hypothetical protein
MFPIPHLSPNSFHSNPNEARSIFNLPWLSLSSCMLLLVHKCLQSLNELFNDTVWTPEVTFAPVERYRTPEVTFALVERYRVVGCQVWKVSFMSNCFWEGPGTKIPGKIKAVGFASGTQPCHQHKMSASTYNFLLRKRTTRESPKSFYVTFYWARTRSGSESLLLSRPRPVQTFAVEDCEASYRCFQL